MKLSKTLKVKIGKLSNNKTTILDRVINKRTRHTYKCESCGYEANADYNAGKNIQQVFLAKCQEEQATINLASNDTISEPKAKKNGSSFNEQSVRNFKRKGVSIPHTDKSVCILERTL